MSTVWHSRSHLSGSRLAYLFTVFVGLATMTMPSEISPQGSMTDREAAVYWMDRWDKETTELRDRLMALGGGSCRCLRMTQGECRAYGLVSDCPGDDKTIRTDDQARGIFRGIYWSDDHWQSFAP